MSVPLVMSCCDARRERRSRKLDLTNAQRGHGPLPALTLIAVDGRASDVYQFLE